MRIGTGSLVNQGNAMMDQPSFGGGPDFGAPRFDVRPAFSNDGARFDMNFGAGAQSDMGLDDFFAGGRPKGGRGTNGYVPEEPQVEEFLAGGRGRPPKGTHAMLQNDAILNVMFADGRGGRGKGTGALAPDINEIFGGTSLV